MAKLSDLMNAASERPSTTVAQPVSQVHMADLLKQLSEPKLVAEFTPHGTTTRQVRTEHDERVLDRVEAMRDQLASRRGLANEAFSRARGI